MLSDLKFGVPCTLVRGGTSKGLMFLKQDLPQDDYLSVILKIMGAPDVYKNQANGVGGGKSTNNKVGIVSRSDKEGIDVEYLFCQVTPNLDVVDLKVNCGNFISAVPFYAVFKGLVPYNKNGNTCVNILNLNTNQVVKAKIKTDENGIITNGNTTLSGASGGFSAIELEYFNVVGSKTGKLFPTGNKIDIIDGLRCTICDVSVPMVIIDGRSIGITEYGDILKDKDFVARLQNIRQKAADLFNFGDVSTSVVPKITIVAKSSEHTIKSFYYDPFVLHDSHAVTGGMCLASACITDGTVANELSNLNGNKIVIEHISGTLEAIINTQDGEITSASFIRTASILMDGKAFVY